jgi:hypothetical protein
MRRALLPLVGLWLAACHLETLPSGGLAETHGLNVTGSELRVRVRALVSPYVDALEAAADDAAARCPGVNVRADALQWKLAAVPAAQDALLQADPVVALLDGWAYAVQMRNLLSGDEGLVELGECSRSAAADMGRIAEEARTIAAGLAGTDASRAHGIVEQWATKNPLRNLFAPRNTMAEALAKESARKQLGALAAVGTIVETLDDLVIRIAAYRETLLKEARWTGELAALQALGSEPAARAVDDVGRMATAAERMGVLMDRMPALIARERKAAVAAVSAEREAVMAGLREEREAVMADIDRQRVETLSALRRDTGAAVDRVDQLSRSAIDQGAARAEAIVDHVILRIAQLLLALGALVLLFLLLAPRIFHLPRRRPT